MKLKYVELAKSNVNQEILNAFDCGHPDFNDFLAKDAIEYTNSGNGVTYILIDNAEENEKVTTIFAFCTLKATALYYSREDSDSLFSNSCVEIKYFGIAKVFQRNRTGKRGVEKYYSTLFLRANENGEKLYRRKKFVDATQYMIPYEEDDELGKCVPMYLSINDNIYNIFGVD